MAIDGATSLHLRPREWYAIRLALGRGCGELVRPLKLKVYLSGHIIALFEGRWWRGLGGRMDDFRR
jgi:hypothetical protein